MPRCPYCDEELTYDEYFGLLAAHQSGKVYGDIYTCNNEDCEAHGETFYTYRHNPDEVHEGYPC